MFLYLVRRHPTVLQENRVELFKILIDEYQNTLDFSICPNSVDDTVLSLVFKCKNISTLKLSNNLCSHFFLIFNKMDV
jgi:hypothetical protein